MCRHIHKQALMAAYRRTLTEERAMPLTVGTIMLGVRDLAGARKFYAEGLGAEVEQDFPNFAKLSLGEGASSLALYEWDAAAKDAGVSPEGAGFRGVSFHVVTDDRAGVDELITRAEAAGGRVVRKPQGAQWGGYFGYFADLDGYLWKVATSG